MGVVSVPGMSIARPTLRRRGLIAVAVILAILLTTWLVRAMWPKDEMTLTLRTPTVAAGIVGGAPVRVQGVQVGTVSEVKRLRNGQQGVVLNVANTEARGLTDNLEAAFSAGNLFGVSEVILTPHSGGNDLRDGAEIAPQRPITDNTVSNMIVTIGDVNNEALRPHMSQILMNFDASSKALLPLFTTVGNIAEAIQDTQRLSTSETFPTITRALASAEGAALTVLPAFRDLIAYQPLHDPEWVRRGFATVDALTNKEDSLTAALEQILNPQAVDGLRTATPMLVNLMKPLLTSFQSAPQLGIQLGQLIDNVRKAMPDTPSGPVLNVRLSVHFPAIAAALPPLPQFEYIPPTPEQRQSGAGAAPRTANPPARPSAGPSASPSASTAPSTPTAGS